MSWSSGWMQSLAFASVRVLSCVLDWIVSALCIRSAVLFHSLTEADPLAKRVCKALLSRGYLTNRTLYLGNPERSTLPLLSMWRVLTGAYFAQGSSEASDRSSGIQQASCEIGARSTVLCFPRGIAELRHSIAEYGFVDTTAHPTLQMWNTGPYLEALCHLSFGRSWIWSAVRWVSS